MVAWGKEEPPEAVMASHPPAPTHWVFPAPIAPWHGSARKAVGDRGVPGGQAGARGGARQQERREAGSRGEAGAEPRMGVGAEPGEGGPDAAGYLVCLMLCSCWRMIWAMGLAMPPIKVQYSSKLMRPSLFSSRSQMSLSAARRFPVSWGRERAEPLTPGAAGKAGWQGRGGGGHPVEVGGASPLAPRAPASPSACG